MTDDARTAPQLIIEELRRQVDHQVTANDGLDTKALAIFGGVAAVAAFIVPRVGTTTEDQQRLAMFTFVALLGSLGSLLWAVRPRVKGFSNGPDVTALAKWIDSAPADLERELVTAFVQVRDQNEGVVAAKGRWTVIALGFLIATVVGMAGMVAAGGIK